ncbi:hypothetical protein [Burkholderia lata]|nr:hypothetical protein [Burkholderia lata]
MMKFTIFRQWRGYVLGAILAVLSSNAVAWSLQYAKVIDSYGMCEWRNNGDGTSTIDLDVKFRSITGALGKMDNGYPKPDSAFVSRGILVYTFNDEGVMLQSKDAAKYVAINGVKATDVFLKGTGYVMYWVAPKYDFPEWKTKDPYSVRVQVMIDNSEIKNWPGIAIRAGNFTNSDDIAESTGGAYVSNIGSESKCAVLDPSVKPPQPSPAIEINMAAPDWNLGELPRNDGTKSLSGPADQLCFTYVGKAEAASHTFLIDATSENGIVGGRYQLKNAKKTQTVPYDLTLDSGSARFNLPNANGDLVKLDKDHKTCFVPTFRTTVDMSVDPDDFSDVLSFTIVTKS